MKFLKTPPSLVSLFDDVIPGAPAQLRKLFGYPAVFVNGNMFAGLHGDRVLVRLGDAERGKLLAMKGAKIFEPMPGRPMREYVVVPPALVEDRAELRRWIARAMAYAASLKAKAKPGTAKGKKAPGASASSKKTRKS